MPRASDRAGRLCTGRASPILGFRATVRRQRMALINPFFDEVIVCDERTRAALDQLRTDVADWFASPTPHQRDMLGAWVNSTAQYDMLVAFAARSGIVGARAAGGASQVLELN